MMKKLLFLFTALLAFSCAENDLPQKQPADNRSDIVDTVSERDQYKHRFSLILSKAVYENRQVRSFLKEQALRKMDNGYNIFYPLVKNEKIGEVAFRDLLARYEENKGELDSIEKNVPLLNIHIPEIDDVKVEDLDVSDNGIPVLFRNKLYYNGEVVDSLDADEVPGFHLFVVCESSSIRLKKAATRSVGGCSIDGTYEYVDRVFNPACSTRALPEYDKLDEKYAMRVFVPCKDVDPLLVRAYNNARGQKRMTRYLMYNGLDSVGQTTSAARTVVHDCIFRFKVVPAAFPELEKITSSTKKPLFEGSCGSEKSPLTREQAISNLLTGRAFCIEFRVNDGEPNSERLKIYATPDKLFYLPLAEAKVHRTMLRHSRYTYRIDKDGIKSKWFYPLNSGCDTRLNIWDVSDRLAEKRITVFMVNQNIEDANGLMGEYRLNFYDDYPVESILGNNCLIPRRIRRGLVELCIMPISNDYYNCGRFEN